MEWTGHGVLNDCGTVPAGAVVQTGEGDLHSHSTQYYQAGDGLVPFVVNQTVTYDGARGQMK